MRTLTFSKRWKKRARVAAKMQWRSLSRLPQLRGIPIVIGGCGRSGTTLLSSILSSHPHIATAKKETRTFCADWKTRGLETAVNIERLYQALLMSDIPPNAKRWCEKTPRNILVVPKILDYFDGRVKIVQIVRDGRDVVTSNHPKYERQYHVSPERWVNDVTIGMRIASLPQVYTFRYEDLVLDYDQTVERLMHFLEEDPHLLGNYPADATVTQHNAWQGEARPISASSIGRWKNRDYADRIESLLSVSGAAEALSHYGYLD